MVSQRESAFGALLQRYRLAGGFTQEYLAERARLSTRGISDLERGLIRRPHADTARRIADALGLARYDRDLFLETARRGLVQPKLDKWTQHVPSGGYLGAIPLGLLVGRELELARIDVALGDVLRRDGRFVVLSGEPGVGKTRLAQEAMMRLQRQGFLVATGRCYSAEQSASYYPFLDILSRLYQGAPVQMRDDTPTRWPYLIRLLPGENLPQPQAIGDNQEQQRLFRAVTGFLLALSTSTPVAALIDDLQWADSATLKLLHHLTVQTHADRVLLVGTRRDGDVAPAPRLADMILNLRREGLIESLALSRLTLEETIRLLGTTLGEVDEPEELGRALYLRGEGNRFFTQELIRSLIERGDLSLHDGRWQGRVGADAPLPPTIRDMVQQRLTRLTPEMQRITRDASVLGQSFHFEELLLLTGRDERAVEDALDDACSSGLVRIVDRERYVFTHALVHEALYASLASARRRRLHMRVGSILAELPEPRRAGRGAEIAHHFREGEDPARTVKWLITAGDEAELVFAHGKAGHEYRAALELLDDAGIGEEQRGVTERELLLRLGHALSLAAHNDEALEVFEKAVSAASAADDLESLTRAVAGVARVHRDRGTPADGIELIMPLLPRLEEEGASSETSATVYIALANLFFTAGRYDDLLWAAERAVARARKAGSEWILAAAEGRCGLAFLQNDRIDEARAMLESAVARAEASTNLECLALALNNLGSMAWNEGRLKEQLPYRQRSVEVAERMDDQNYLVVALSHLGGAHLVLGHWREAREYQTRAMALLDAVGSSAYAAYPYAGLVAMTCAEGKFKEAAHLAEKGLELAVCVGDVQAIAFLERDLAETHLRRGRPEVSRDRLEAMRERLGDTHALALRILPGLAEAYLALGEIESAKEVANLARIRADEVKQFMVLVDALRVWGAVLSRMGAWSEAETALSESVVRARALGNPFMLARSLDELSELHIRKGERDCAAPYFDEAQSIYQMLGAAAHYRA